MKKSLFKLVTSLALMATVGLSLVSWSNKNVKDEVGKKAKDSVIIPMETTTIFGDKINNDIFKENEITLVNIMATWCGPCIKELPELQEIAVENNNIGVIGAVYDTRNIKNGVLNEKAIEESKSIANKVGVTYPLVIPTTEFFDATLKNLAAILPLSFIVDSNGKVLAGPIAGAKSKAQWLDLLNSYKQGK